MPSKLAIDLNIGRVVDLIIKISISVNTNLSLKINRTYYIG